MKNFLFIISLLTLLFIPMNSVFAYNAGGVQFGKVNKSYLEPGSTSEYSIYQYAFEFDNSWHTNIKTLMMSIGGVGPDQTTVYPIGAVDYQLNIIIYNSSNVFVSGTTIGYVDMMIYETDITPGLESISFYYNGTSVWSITINDMSTNNFYVHTQDILTFNFDLYSRGVIDGYNDGFNNGYNSGYDDGVNTAQVDSYNQGYVYARSEYGFYDAINEIWVNAVDFGFQQYTLGFNDGQLDEYGIDILGTIMDASQFTDHVLSANLGGGFMLYHLFMIPIVFGVLFLIIKFSRG